MMANETTLTKKVSSIGEDIGREEGRAMVDAAHPADVKGWMVGREIIEQILAQPGVEGINILQGLDVDGTKKLVFIGLDENGNSVLEFPVVNAAGSIEQKPAIVADRVRTQTENIQDSSWFDWLRWAFGI
jgi:hypothetical protein